MSETIVVLDFGSQYSQLIARRIRECRVYSKIMPYYTSAEAIRAENPKGIILSGGPASVYSEHAPKCDPAIFELGIPVLGICYGLQLMIHTLGGEITRGHAREYGKAMLKIVKSGNLFLGLDGEIQVWMSHGDKVAKMPAGGFEILGSSGNTEFCAVHMPERNLYGIQFHPEVVHTPQGKTIIGNFCKNICKCVGDWTMESFIEQQVREIRAKVGSANVILGLSGGVDSSVAAALIHKAIGKQLNCIFVNNGLLRKNEAERVRNLFGRAFDMKLIYVDATERFLARLAGVEEPEKKRKIIGNEFVQVFDDASAQIEQAEFLAQGTTYPDVIESVPIDGNPAAMIKSHHNVGGLPKEMKFQLLEPLSRLFKDEVREVGRQLGLPEDVVMRQPFPGPGLAVRHLGAVSQKTLDILRDADEIVVEEIKKAGLYYSIWQTFAVFLPIRTVGVMGDERTYDYVIALRAVESTDGMTADWVQLPYDLLGRISSRIINEVNGVNRVVYDITSKPPGTIEWE
ncbi:glutamine-hydrolyzing GMP synthase [Victivallis vadensis]|uniref:GMP synthase [glutamine-hydrolyzing] n=1 Tax=Victivallis vadensis TaxID=172901 RepID=A0A2U1B9S2_9BACT|nr:glutamine-hydrolyzing GMP synthase [Victivallis vadensis]PVY45277.1 GMP synthase (glutamine-hydrolysing) [Victivallis vadensis]HJH03354.1 glutamine-hydrolyzing GMP synthase [Victivallis vadensis]